MAATANRSRRSRKTPCPESLRRDLAAYRLQVAQVEIARHPAIALDLLAFQAASEMLGKRPRLGRAGRGVQRPPQAGQASSEASAAAACPGSDRASHCRPTGSRPTSEAARFEAFRSLPEAAKLELLAYCVALTLQPKLGPAEGDEATAYDAALSLTGGKRGRLLASDQGQLPGPHQPRPVAGDRPRGLGRTLGAIALQRQESVAGRSARPGLRRSGQVTAGRPSRSRS